MSPAILAAFVLLATISPTAEGGQRPNGKRVLIPPRVARIVVPILDQQALALKQSTNQSEGSPTWKVGVLMGKLFENQSSTSDEALVVLLYYYIGEANGGDQLAEIVCRGNRMLPYLDKYESVRPEIPGRRYSGGTVLELRTVKGNFAEVRNGIEKGESASACQSRP